MWAAVLIVDAEGSLYRDRDNRGRISVDYRDRDNLSSRRCYYRDRDKD